MANAAGVARGTAATRKRLETLAIAEMRTLGADVFNLLWKVTPVDTSRARSNWVLSPGRRIPPTPVYPHSRNARARATTALRRMRKLDSITIYNRTPYILSLEAGKSKQAPKGMLRAVQARYGGRISAR